MGSENVDPIPAASVERPPASTAPLDKKAEIRSRIFSSQANDKIIPIPPKPPEPKPENDTQLLGYVALGFFAISVFSGIASTQIVFSGNGPNPLEALAMLTGIASAVIVVWWFFKAHKFKFQFIPPDDEVQ